jgi:hypothetical protein
VAEIRREIVSSASPFVPGRQKAAQIGHETCTLKRLKLLPYQLLKYWLGREDSNLRMAESKSSGFLLGFNAHSENFARLDLLSINGLGRISEYRAGTHYGRAAHFVHASRPCATEMKDE